jgi:LysM repeat protein
MVTRNVAPAAALLAVTAAVLAIHYGVQQRSSPAAPVIKRTIPHPVHAKHTAPISRFYVVQRGDSFSVIAERTHTSVARLERLNPGVSTTALRVGQKIRVE